MGVRPGGSAVLGLEKQREILEQQVGLAVADFVGRRRHLDCKLDEHARPLAAEPLTILVHIRATAGGPAPAQQAGIKVVQEGSAQQRVQPDVTIAFARLDRIHAQSALQEMTERTFRSFLELSGRDHDVGKPGSRAAPAAGT